MIGKKVIETLHERGFVLYRKQDINLVDQLTDEECREAAQVIEAVFEQMKTDASGVDFSDNDKEE